MTTTPTRKPGRVAALTLLAATSLVFVTASCREPGQVPAPSLPPDHLQGAATPVPGPDAADAADAAVAAVAATSAGNAWTYAGWTVEPKRGGELKLRYKHTEVASLGYVAFGPKWEWAAPQPQEVAAKGPGHHPFSFTTHGLPITVTGDMFAAKGGFRVDYTLKVASDIKDMRGMGLQFQLRLDRQLWPTQPVPQLLADGTGFRLPCPGGDTITVTLDGGAKASFERGNKNVVRIVLAANAVPQGEQKFSMHIALPDGAKVLPSIRERYGTAPHTRWHRDALVWDDTPVDLSFLNAGHRPAGKHGSVRAEGDALVFEDGTPARFWGTNIVAYALFEGTRADIAGQAKRLAALGYNLVRIHHHDVAWARPNVFDLSDGSTQKLSAKSVDQLDWWIKCLRDEGIYVWIDLHVGRTFLPGDKISGFNELKRAQKGEARGFNYVNPRIEQLMERFAQQYLGHRNPHTGHAWVDDPAVMGVLITNENDLTDHFGTAFLADKGHALHRSLFEARAAKARKSLGLSAQQTRQLWQPGAPKVLLAELQHRFDARATAHLRSIGVKVPIATTSYWGRDKLFGLAALVGGDVIDAHAYGQAEALSKNPRFASNWIHFLATAQVTGKPMTVTEWAVPAPAPDRFTAPLYVAAIGALQGWDMLTAYTYNMGPTAAPRRTNKWVQWTDPASIALAPAAALMFRRGDVAPARKTYVIRPGRAGVWDAANNAENSATLRTLAEHSRIQIELPDLPELDWDGSTAGAADATIVTRLDHDFIPAGQNFVRSDTGELERDWVRGVQTINTPRSQAAIGWIGGQQIELADVIFELDTPKAAVVVSSLDGKPIDKSDRLLVTAVARAEPDPKKPGSYRSEPVTGRIVFLGGGKERQWGWIALSSRSRASSAPAGRTITATQIEQRKGGSVQVFTLPHRLSTHWFILERGPV